MNDFDNDSWIPEQERRSTFDGATARCHLPRHELWSLLQAPSVSWIERARLP